MAASKRKLPAEKIVSVCHIATVYNPHLLKSRQWIVQLACGHYARTTATKRCHCLRCQQMLDSGEDWDAFRNHDAADTMAWPADPVRALNEPSSHADVLKTVG